MKVFYNCDPLKNKKCFKLSCSLNGGECTATSDVACASDLVTVAYVIEKRDRGPMETLHTRIKRGVVKFNSPVEYRIVHKGTEQRVTDIKIQKGPVLETGLNGIFLEDLLLICIDQVEHFQDSDYACVENEDTLRHLRDALHSTRSRQYERSLRGVQGTNGK